MGILLIRRIYFPTRFAELSARWENDLIGIHAAIMLWQQTGNVRHDQVRIALAGFTALLAFAFHRRQPHGLADVHFQYGTLPAYCPAEKIIGLPDDANRKDRNISPFDNQSQPRLRAP